METSTKRSKDETTISFISTGTVSLRPSLQSQPSSRPAVLRRARMMADRRWTHPVPVGVFLIHHPDGPILFDTGEDPNCNAAGYFPNFTFKALTTMHIGPGDGILDHLQKLGCDPRSLQAIVMSHLHHDHAGGLKALSQAAPHVPIYVSEQHWEAFGKNSTMATFEGFIPNTWPENFAPRLIVPNAAGIGPWKKSYALTSDHKVIVVETPGHVVGHLSLFVRGHHSDGSETNYFLPGDATYNMEVLENEETDGSTWDAATAISSLRLIKELAQEMEIVVLPSHDVNTPQMLEQRLVYRPKLSHL